MVRTRKSHNRTPSAPWFSKELKQLIRRKNRLFKKAHASGNPDHWKTYCLERNKTTAAIKRAKSVHFNNQVNTLSDPNCSPSRWWQVARDLCGLQLKRGVSSCVPPLLDSRGNVISEPVEKANLVFTDILAGFTVNNRVLRLPAIVLLNTTFRPGNSGLLRVYVQAF